MFYINHSWLYPGTVPVDMPVGLHHQDSNFCWCDPVIEVDEDGNEDVLHRQVTWN